MIENPIRGANEWRGMTPMHFAATNRNEEALKVLVTFTDNLDVVDNFGATVLHYAAANGNVNILRFLGPLMKNPNAPCNFSHLGKTPIDWANRCGHGEFARILQSYIKSYIELDLD